MRVKSELWVRAYIRQRQAHGVFAAVVAHGHDEAGAILIKVSRLDGQAALYGPAPAGFAIDSTELPERTFVRLHGPETIGDADADALIATQRSYDSDLWVVEVEDRAGAHGLDGWLATP